MIDKLYAYFRAWLEEVGEEEVEKESAFLCICPDGAGWIGDGAGGVFIEFDSMEDGIKVLRQRFAKVQGSSSSRELWGCNLCEKYGTVVIGHDEGVWGGVQKILDDHMLKSPDCKGSRGDIRVF